MAAALQNAAAAVVAVIGTLIALGKFRRESTRLNAEGAAALVSARSADWQAYAKHLEARIDQLAADIEHDRLRNTNALARVGAKLDSCEDHRRELADRVLSLTERLAGA